MVAVAGVLLVSVVATTAELSEGTAPVAEVIAVEDVALASRGKGGEASAGKAKAADTRVAVAAMTARVDDEEKEVA